MLKLNTMEIQQYHHALLLRVNQIRMLYQESKAGILNVADIQEQVNMNKKQILELHKKMFHYWHGKSGKWYSYLPKKELIHQKESKLKVLMKKN